jgi:hypothetical protein
VCDPLHLINTWNLKIPHAIFFDISTPGALNISEVPHMVILLSPPPTTARFL